MVAKLGWRTKLRTLSVSNCQEEKTKAKQNKLNKPKLSIRLGVGDGEEKRWRQGLLVWRDVECSRSNRVQHPPIRKEADFRHMKCRRSSRERDAGSHVVHGEARRDGSAAKKKRDEHFETKHSTHDCCKIRADKFCLYESWCIPPVPFFMKSGFLSGLT